MRWFISILAGLALLAATGAYLHTPAPLVYDVPDPELPDDLDLYLSQREKLISAAGGLIPRTEKRIVWQTEGQKTDLAVVYLHGFSATRQELAPTTELVANALGANLFETRLAGHGLKRDPLTGVTAEQWLADGTEALAIGARIGRRLVLIGTSTGATLGVALADHPLMQSVEALVLISPNFAPSDPAARWLTRPGGPLVMRYVMGDTYSWTAYSQTQARYWTTSYPTTALVEMMRLVDFAEAQLPLTLAGGVLLLVSRRDTIVSPEAALQAFDRIDAPLKRLIEMGQVGDPSQHVLAGHILSPETTDAVVENIVTFIDNALANDSS